MKVILDFETLPPQKITLRKRELSPELQAVMKEAEEKRAWRLAHPEDFEAQMKKVLKGGPLFDGIDGLEYQRKVRYEWED